MHKSNQIELIYEDIYEAIRADVMVIGGPKAVGSELWPTMKVNEASTRLNNCLNRTRPEKLDPEEVLHIKRLARKKGSYSIVHFEADEIGITRAEPIDPEDEIANLQREFNQNVGALSQLAKRIEKLSK